MEKMQSQSLDNLSIEDTIKKAHNDAQILCSKTKISDHVAVNSSCNLSYINFLEETEFLSFTVNENPFGIYDKIDEKELDKLKAADYSFPISCVKPNVVVYFEEYTKYVNENFKFDTIKGETSYKDNKTKTTGTFNKIRNFFNLPEESKAKEPSLTAHLRIDPNKYVKTVPPTSYNIIIKKYDKTLHESIKSLRELMVLLTKKSSHKVYIKPTKLCSSFKHYGELYKISWQIFAIQETQIKINDVDKLKLLLLNDDDSETSEENKDENEFKFDDDDKL